MTHSIYVAIFGLALFTNACGSRNENVSESAPTSVSTRFAEGTQQVQSGENYSLALGVVTEKSSSVEEFCVLGLTSIASEHLSSEELPAISDVFSLSQKSISIEAIEQIQNVAKINSPSKELAPISSTELENLKKHISTSHEQIESVGLSCTHAVITLKSKLGIATDDEETTLGFGWRTGASFLVWGAVNLGSAGSHDWRTQGQWMPEPYPTRPRVEQIYRPSYPTRNYW